MKRVRIAGTLFAAFVVIALSVVISPLSAASPPGEIPCGDQTTVSGQIGGISVGASRDCPQSGAPSAGRGSGADPVGPPTVTYDCGAPVDPGLGAALPAGDVCRNAVQDCVLAAQGGPPPGTTTTETWMEVGGQMRMQSVDCNARPGGAAVVPVLTPLMVRQEALRLLPVAPIHSAPADGLTFVNMQTVLWVDSGAQQDLAPVTLLGRRVTVRISAASVKWDFGDGTATVGPLGRAYDGSCASAQCPGFWGHDYTATGTPTVQATVSWTATYTVDGGPVQIVPGGPLIAGTARLPLVVRQARGVLVPDPVGR